MQAEAGLSLSWPHSWPFGRFRTIPGGSVTSAARAMRSAHRLRLKMPEAQIGDLGVSSIESNGIFHQGRSIWDREMQSRVFWVHGDDLGRQCMQWRYPDCPGSPSNDLVGADAAISKRRSEIKQNTRKVVRITLIEKVFWEKFEIRPLNFFFPRSDLYFQKAPDPTLQILKFEIRPLSSTKVGSRSKNFLEYEIRPLKFS